MTVDLNNCVPGQKVRLRSGEIVEYQLKITVPCYYFHEVGSRNYTDDGYYYTNKRENFRDIVEILPIETIKPTKFDKHPSVAWWESCPWITDRKPTKEDGDNLNQVIIVIEGKLSLCFMHWEYVESGYPWIHSLPWNRPKQTPKEQAIKLINKHENGWTPTPEQWDIIREGLKE